MLTKNSIILLFSQIVILQRRHIALEVKSVTSQKLIKIIEIIDKYLP